ncbi:MAG: CoA transferase [Deltaproteobacteria bacterium]|nr:CoA transferase [Deltaproteobacteria bacterium]
MPGVLDGVRVLDFGRYIAGPFCAALLADLGAEVIRVERIGGGEDRGVIPVGAEGDGSLYLQTNRNKLGMTLDPAAPEGRGVVRRLVAWADVVVANLPPATLRALGLDYASLAAIKPDVILTSISAFGCGGPYEEKLGFDGIGQAMSGAMYLSGSPDEPMKAFVPYVDYATALTAAFGTLAALLHRRASGRGQEVQASLLATALTITNAYVVEQALLAPNRVASGNRSQIAAPSDAFPVRDGWIIVQVVGGPLFRRWAALMGEDHWLTDPRFADDRARGEHGAIVSARMREWCATRTTAEALAALAAARIPAGPVYSPQQVLDDPHVRASALLEGVAYPGTPRPVPLSATPVRLSATPGSIRRRAPRLGEHTDEILARLGYVPAEIAALRATRVV